MFKPIARSLFVAPLAAVIFTTGAATAQDHRTDVVNTAPVMAEMEGPPTAQAAEFVGTPDVVSVNEGGWQHFELNAGPENANRWYLILGSLSGTQPGIILGDFLIPLQYDFYTDFTLTMPNAGLIRDQLARLDEAGQATADFYLPPRVALDFIGMTMNHVYVVANESAGIAAVSEPVPLHLDG